MQVARLTLLNSSDCEWQIVITPLTNGDSRTWKLTAAKSLDLELAGGDCVIVQTLLVADAKPALTRRFSMHFEAGQSYRWRLMTLLSGAPVSAGTKDDHE